MIKKLPQLMILNLQIIDLRFSQLLFDWKIDNIHRSYKLVNNMHNMKDGRINRIRFYQFENAWIKHTKHNTESHNVAISTDSKEYFCADQLPSTILFRILNTALKAKQETIKAKNANNIVLNITFYFLVTFRFIWYFYV